MAAGAERDEGERGSERGASGVRPAPSALPPARGARVARAPIRRRPAAAARLPARWTKPESPRPEPCPRPPAAATSPARAAPSPPAPCPSATPRSYLMTIAPRPGGRCSPPRLEEPESFMIVSFCWIVAILPWLRPRPAICPISQESPVLAP